MDYMTRNYNELLEFIKKNNPKITFGVVFSISEGRKHRLWCGSEERPAFRISLRYKL